MPLSPVLERFSEPAKFIVHMTDFSPSAEMAFAHALRLALVNKARLTLLHVGDEEHLDWNQFPSLRETLQRWGMLQDGASRVDVLDLGVEVEKVIVRGHRVSEALVGYYNTNVVDLLVLATDQRSHWTHWLRSDTTATVANKLSIPTLFVPAHGRGCVSLEDGHVSMQQVLIPVGHDSKLGIAVERGLRALSTFGNEKSQLTLLHVGSEAHFPEVPVPRGPWKVVRAVRSGSPSAEIIAAANEIGADLIVMVTKGSEGILDVLRGSTTEQVMRAAPCPVLSIPEDY